MWTCEEQFNHKQAKGNKGYFGGESVLLYVEYTSGS